jgi:hypothetical protein
MPNPVEVCHQPSPSGPWTIGGSLRGDGIGGRATDRTGDHSMQPHATTTLATHPTMHLTGM